MRIAMGVEYDGTDFSGWQTQNTRNQCTEVPRVRTVQQVLEQALATVADQQVTTHCAGRTDAGVHAQGQVIHFDTKAQRSSRAWVLGTNVNLPPDVSVRWAVTVNEDFHARFSATDRHYRYVILNCQTRPALMRQQVFWSYHDLDESLMQTAALGLLGTHDFSSYRAAGCQAKQPIRTVKYLTVRRCKETIVIEIGADAFLYRMVRNIVGVLMAIGQGGQPTGWAREVLDMQNRTKGGITVPPQGLCLSQVDYSPNFGLPKTTRSWALL